MQRQLTRPLIIRGLKSEAPGAKGEVTELGRIPYNDRIFDEAWLQDLLLKHPSLLPISEVEPVFGGAKPVCRELPVNGGAADLLLINTDGFITVVETKLWRNPESRFDVVAQVVRYASDMARWSYSKLRDQVKKVPKGLMAGDYTDDPVLDIVKAGEGEEFDKIAFKDNVNQNLSRGRLLLLIVGDAIREQLERVAEHLQHFPTLDLALGLVEIAFFRERSDSTDPIIVQPSVSAKTHIIERTVVQLKAPLKPSDVAITVEKGTQLPHSIIEEEYYEALNGKAGQKVVEFVREVLAEAGSHGLRVDWMRSGPVLKYDEPMKDIFLAL